MQEALSLFSDLQQDDVQWILEQGTEQQVIAETLIIDEGTVPDAIYIVLEGLVGVVLPSADNYLIAKLGPGELLGELSLVDGRAASASVKAVENTLLLVLSRQVLETKVSNDPGFALRYHRALGLILSRRLRETVGTLGFHIAEKPMQENMIADGWSRIEAAVDHMKEMLKKADQEALKNHDQIPEALAAEIEENFHALMAHINLEIGENSGLCEFVQHEVGAKLQREVLPFMLLTRFAERCYSKPRGYAGDFLTIEWIYQNAPHGSGRLGPLLDRCFLNVHASKAVRNRRGLLADHIRHALANSEGRPAQITSMACGPAAEIFDVFAELDDPGKLRATLIDIDLQALAFVSDRCDRQKLRRQMELVNGNLVYLASGRQKIKVCNQDLVYSIGLIDYFNDKFVITLLNYVHSLLRPGGKVVLGNFHPDNPNKALMDHILNWKLVHRSEDDMNRLFRASSFSCPCTDITFEDEKVNLFAECVRA